ncbi:Type 1 glutamine amidotransferase-like domain-containing protein [Pseudoalteromonas xiamenensis]|uniref:Type 1 glutamine amidotransferase-like domain-containing protein n=1 Tax=Pseudoalteromonas xiamenensis TaxID=882626 RepID=UPI0035E7099F
MKTTVFAASLCAMLASVPTYACLTAEIENNDLESTANQGLCSGVLVQGSINSRQDVDWYTFNATSNGNITLSLTHAQSDDFDWSLFRTTGSAVLSGATSANPEIGNYQGESGEYFVKVTRYSGTGWYDLTINYPEDRTTPPALCEYGSRPTKPGALKSFIVGSDNDVCPTLSSSAGVLLMGGGTDVDESFSNRVKPHINGGDVVVLRTSGTDAYNDYLLPLTGADSVETLIVDTISKANSDYVDWAIRSAEFVFIAGGDQSDYLNQWLGTKVQSALSHVYEKHGIIGGTSAGNAIQGQYIYDPDGLLGAISEEVVTDFCHETIHLSSNFLATPILQGVITDTHFSERDRMGRMASFFAHISSQKYAIGVSEHTAMFAVENGDSVIDGTGHVYVLAKDAQTQFQQTACGKPLIIRDLLNYRLQSGDQFNLSTGATNVLPSRLSIDGNKAQFYSPTNPY